MKEIEPEEYDIVGGYKAMLPEPERPLMPSVNVLDWRMDLEAIERACE